MSDADADTEDDDLTGHFRWLADWCEETSPLYERLSRGVASDPDVLALAAEVPDQRSPPHVLLAAVHYLLLRGAEHRLAEFYPSVTDDPWDPATADPYPAFREFCLSRTDDLRSLLRERRTQTNSVRRCAALYPAFGAVAERAGEPLALIEVGPSAGLNLLWDHYAYDYGTGRLYGTTDSPVVVESETRGDVPLPERPPAVASRVGVDLNPLDVTDDRDADWLRALVWPEHDDRRRLLNAALEYTREHPPSLVAGDAVQRLPDLVRDAPPDAPVCVFDTQVLYQFPDEAREQFRATLRDLGADHDLYWLSGEASADDYENAIDLRLSTYENGPCERRLAVYEQHGQWVTWDW